MEENVARKLPGEVNPRMLTPLHSMSNGLWSCQMLSRGLGGGFFPPFFPCKWAEVNWLWDAFICRETELELWLYAFKVKRHNSEAYRWFSVSITVMSARLTPTAGCCDPPISESVRSIRTVERTGVQMWWILFVLPFVRPRRAVNILPRWCADGCWCEIWSFPCCSVGCHLCLFIILKRNEAVLSASLKEQQDVACSPRANQPAATPQSDWDLKVMQQLTFFIFRRWREKKITV